MSTKGKIPDAWDDDDWVNKADEEVPKEPTPPPKKLTKAERRAIQAEFNRQLWEQAEAPAAPYYVESQREPPQLSTLKPNVTLLARKPAPTLIARKDPETGIEKLTIDEDEDDDDGKKLDQMTPEKRALKTQKEREEKQRRYEEARERLFGPTTSGSTSPRSSTPPARSSERGKGRGRGNGCREPRDSRLDSASSSRTRQLYDPNFTIRQESGQGQRKETSEPKIESQIIRSPRGPDGSGRGGIGFVNRGNKA